MELSEVFLFLAVGSLAGLAGGLLGIGGGLIFTPTLFFYFKSTGIPDEYVVPLSIGTGLMCTWVVALSSAIGHYQRDAVHIGTALTCGVAAAFGVWATSVWITTSAWFTAGIFQHVFAVFLVIVAARMIVPARSGKSTRARSEESLVVRHPAAVVAGGGIAGFVASLVGVGGGIVLVPLYTRFFNMNIRLAVGSSSATIVIITLTAILAFAVQGSGLAISSTALGYVDLKYAAILAVPAAITARFGVALAHRLDRTRLRRIFGILALLVAGRLFLGI